MRRALVLLLLILFAAAFSPAVAQPQPTGEIWRNPAEMWRGIEAAPDPNRQWTLLVYLDADNNLEGPGVDDLKEMERGLPERGVEVIVLIDRAKGFDSRFGDWTGARLYRVRRSTRTDVFGSEQLADLGELDMGNPTTLRAFVEGGLRLFPARRQGLVMWNHGGGWAALASDDDAPGTNSGRSALTTAQVGTALSEALQAAGVPRLDFIGFDMCLMSQTETAVEVAPFGRIMVGSQALEPGEGWPYDRVLPDFGDFSLSTDAIAQRAVKHYEAYYAERREKGATQSAVDLDRVEELRLALDAMGRKLQSAMPEQWSPLTRAIFFAQAYFPRDDFRKGKSAISSVDLTDLAGRVRRLAPGAADAEAERVVAAAKAAVLGNSTTDSFRFSRGLSIYAPPSGQQFDANYGNTRLARTTAWPAALRSLFDIQAARLTPPRVAALRAARLSDGAPVRSADVGGGYGIRATIEGHNVLWVEMFQGPFNETTGVMRVLTRSYLLDPLMIARRPDQFADLVDYAMPQLDKDRNELSAEFVGTRLVVGNGEQYGQVTTDHTDLSDPDHFSIRALFNRADGSNLMAIVKFNAVTLRAVTVIGEAPLPDGRITYRQFRPDPFDVVTLMVETLGLDGSQALEAGMKFRWANGLDAKLANDQPGEIAIAVRPESIGGASAIHVTTLRARPLTEASAEFERRARLLRPDDLLGEWDVYLITPTASEPQYRTLTITSVRGGLEYTLTGSGPAGTPREPDESGTLVLDTAFTPTLRLMKLDDQRRPLSAQSFAARILPGQNGERLVTLKYLHPSGLLLAIFKRDGTGVPSTSGAFAPPAAPPVAAAINPGADLLLGQWRGADGAMLWFAGTQYAIYQGGQVVEVGNYVRQGDFLYMSRPNGVQTVYGVAFQGAALYLRDPFGAVYSFARLQ